MYYLAYGMNTNLGGMSRRCPKAESMGKVVLQDYILAFRGCCDIIHAPGQRMECALWNITSECEAALDILEGYPNFYGKKEVKVKYKNRTIRAMIYFMQDRDLLDFPSESYLQMVSKGYRQHNMDITQIERALSDVESEFNQFLI